MQQALEGCDDMLIKKNWTATGRIQEICWLDLGIFGIPSSTLHTW